MIDFKRIGGEIASSPLNENFRKIKDSISMANTNIVFPSENAVVGTVTEMQNIVSPVTAQWCYVISNGCAYRYSGSTWIKIGDFGETFKQNLLNNGAVLLEAPLSLKTGSDNVIIIPNLLIYFKDKEGDNSYLGGMYKVTTSEYDISTDLNVTSEGVYSLYINDSLEITSMQNLPIQDYSDKIFLGQYIITDGKKVVQDCLYTMPDMAYTSDRGYFIFQGGEAQGCDLIPSLDSTLKVNRQSGFYYDEGANYPIGQIIDYPSNGVINANLKAFIAVNGIDIYYLSPNGIIIENDLIPVLTLDSTLYWNNNQLESVPSGKYTIQRHIISPTGQNFIYYGDTLYDSISDALFNMNNVNSLSIPFLHAETTRIAIKQGAIATNNPEEVRFITTSKLTQVGTVVPEFEDSAFSLYRNNSTAKFDLSLLTDGVARTVKILDKDYTLADNADIISLETEVSNKLENTATVNGQSFVNSIEGIPELNLTTTNIGEGNNKYFTNERVSLNLDVVANTAHRNTTSGNPHGSGTNDIPETNNKKYISGEQLTKLDNLPTSTNINQIETYEDNTLVSNATKKLNFADGLIVTLDGITANKVNVDIDATALLTTSDYADGTMVLEESTIKKVKAASISEETLGIYGEDVQDENAYYGTDSVGAVGWATLPTFVSSVETVYGNIATDDILYVPVDGSVTELKLDNNVRAKLNAPNSMIVYDSGVWLANDITRLNFGSNLGLSLNSDTHQITINATGEGGTGGVTSFVDLDDVNITYDVTNDGKALTIDSTTSKIVVSDLPSVNDLMLKTNYASLSAGKVLAAELADSATNALSLQNKTVNDTLTTSNNLWTALKTSQTIAGKPDTHYGVGIPDNQLGKDGDIYVELIEV